MNKKNFIKYSRSLLRQANNQRDIFKQQIVGGRHAIEDDPIVYNLFHYEGQPSYKFEWIQNIDEHKKLVDRALIPPKIRRTFSELFIRIKKYELLRHYNIVNFIDGKVVYNGKFLEDTFE